MKLGTENKKQLFWLGGLFLVLGYVLYTNVLAPGDVPQQAAAARSTRPPVVPGAAPSAGFAQRATPQPPQARPRPGFRARTGPQFKMEAKGVDVTTIDPTLRLDLLAKVQSVTLGGGTRNLFQFGAAPLPKAPEPKVIPKPAPQPEPPKPAEPVKPPPPPIPLKFFGYSQARPGEKRAFFLDGEEIVVATEGELIKRRYKVVRIGLNSVVVEDTEYKNQQTLALEEQAG